MRSRRLAFDGSAFLEVEALIEEARQRQRLRRKYLGVSALLIVGVVAGLIIATGGGSDNRTPRVSNVQSRPISSNPSATNQARAATTTLHVPGLLLPEVEKSEQRVVVGAGSIWVMTNVFESTVHCAANEVVQINRHVGCSVSFVDRIDPKNNRIIARIRYPGAWAITYGAGAVWLVSGKIFGYSYYLYEINPSTDRLERTITVPTAQMLYATGAYGEITVGNGDVYFTDLNSNRPGIAEVSVATGHLLDTISLPSGCHGGIPIMATGGLLWGGCGAVNVSSGGIKYNLNLPNNFSGYSATLIGDNLWVAGGLQSFPHPSGPHGAMVDIDTTNGRIAHVYKDDAVAVTSFGSRLWAAENHTEFSTVQIDPTTGRESHRVPQPQLGGGNWWVNIAATANELAIEDWSQTRTSSLVLVRT